MIRSPAPNHNRPHQHLRVIPLGASHQKLRPALAPGGRGHPNAQLLRARIPVLLLALSVLGCGERARTGGTTPAEPSPSAPTPAARMPDPLRFTVGTPTPRAELRAVETSEWARLDSALRSGAGETIGAATLPICQSGDGPCAEAGRRLAAAAIGDPLLWEVLGALRAGGKLPVAGFYEALAPRLLEAADAETRDRFLRLAVASGAARVSDPTPRGARALVLPPRPRSDAPFWIVVELPALCPSIRSTDIGPTADGLWRVQVEADCGTDGPPTSRGLRRRARRHLHVRSFPGTVPTPIELWIGDDPAPILRIGG